MTRKLDNIQLHLMDLHSCLLSLSQGIKNVKYHQKQKKRTRLLIKCTPDWYLGLPLPEWLSKVQTSNDSTQDCNILPLSFYTRETKRSEYGVLSGQGNHLLL